MLTFLFFVSNGNSSWYTAGTQTFAENGEGGGGGGVEMTTNTQVIYYYQSEVTNY